MLNVEQITSSLARMPDQALQRYAAMHKNDPYIIALAMSESNRRKEIRQAAQGAQGQMPQPKVVDQDIAAMAPQSAPMPEDQGIARLPAGPMNFADGGIVAFAGEDGSYVDGYYAQPLTAEELGSVDPYARLRKFAEWAGRNVERDPVTGEVVRKTPYEAPARLPATASKFGDYGPSMYESQAGTTATEKPAVKAGTPQRNLGPGQAATPTGGFTALMNAIKAPDTAADQVNPYVKQMEDLTAGRVKAREKEAAGLEAIQKQFADVYKGREERLSQREGELAGMKDQHLGLALLQAGAAMMSTPGSIGMAVGKGIDTGSKQYVAGMDKLNAAKEKLSDARDRLEELQSQRGEMSARELLKAKSAIDTEKSAGQELLIRANMDMYKLSREEAIKRLDMQTRVGIAQLQEQGQTARTNAQIAAQAIPAEMRGAMLLGTGDTQAARIESGLKKMQEIQADKSGMAAVSALAKINAEERKNGEPLTTMADMMAMARQYTALMYPKVGDNQPTRERPR